MSYYSTMQYFTFKSSLSEDELANRYREFIEHVKSIDKKLNSDKHKFLGSYSFNEIGDNHFEIYVGDSLTQKHYSADLLAVFLSSVIDDTVGDDKQTIDIIIYGEDNYVYGYRVSRNCVSLIEPIFVPLKNVREVEFTGFDGSVHMVAVSELLKTESNEEEVRR